MLFTLGSCRKRFDNHQNTALNFGIVFDQNISKDQAFSDWPGCVPRAIAACTTKNGNQLATGQVQGMRGNRLYAATMYSPSRKKSYSDSIPALTLADLRLVLPAPMVSSSDAPAFGEGGYVLAERSVTYMFRSPGTPQAYGTYSTYQGYTSHSGSDVIYTDTSVNSVLYTLSGRIPATVEGSVVGSYQSYTASAIVGYMAVGPSQGAGYMFGTIDGGYRLQQSGRNAQGQFWSNPAQFLDGNGISGSVAANADTNLRISMAVSGANETPVPSWMGALIYIGKSYFMMRYDFDTDLTSNATLVPGNSASFTFNGQNYAYPDRINL
ncbi:hypothetical protein MPK71_gp062 [Erwinia phage pEa_SNUABM_1]|uniref:Uncharacterized protein n=1 Tax=Erwinia phage pEa_SNUABM_1 TaxID=2869543 RepID=A0AAE7XL88_9CAUD|nr:hypothetical protein MPK71_gp062 [Erwinia phage pEa_SNUABM_1]QZE57271.1 hypothetical protein pEaSNUABM1_00062 [Erwinia phage pEa_SNUABM_1]